MQFKLGPRSVKLQVGDVQLGSVDTVRFAALMRYLDQVGGEWPQLRRLQRGEAQVDPDALLAELEAVMKTSPSRELAPVLGNLRDNTLQARARAGA